MTTPTSAPLDRPDDPVFLHSRREALVILGLWAAAMLWVVPFSYFYGYHEVPNPDELELILGIPAWVFWGVLVPWIVCTLATIGLCVWFIKDEDLESADAGSASR